MTSSFGVVHTFASAEHTFAGVEHTFAEGEYTFVAVERMLVVLVATNSVVDKKMDFSAQLVVVQNHKSMVLVIQDSRVTKRETTERCFYIPESTDTGIQ